MPTQQEIEIERLFMQDASDKMDVLLADPAADLGVGTDEVRSALEKKEQFKANIGGLSDTVADDMAHIAAARMLADYFLVVMSSGRA